MSQTDLLVSLAALGRPKALVVGDLIFDRYCWGAAERISQEAPVVVLRSDRREARLGGAANVCQMLGGLDATVTCAGVVGGDSDGAELREHLTAAGVDHGCVLEDPSRPTTVKERFIGRAAGSHPHQILRVDREVCDPLDNRLEAALGEAVLSRLAEHDVVIVSDYDKGVCTPTLLRRIIDAARAADVPVVVDPRRGGDYGRYRRATTMTPNRHEAAEATGQPITSTESARTAGEKLCRDLELDLAIVTLDRDGMALVWPEGRGELFPTQVRSVYDITGAGDMVISTIGLCLAAGIEPSVAARLANVAAGLEVEQVGVVVVRRDEIRGRIVAGVDRGNAKVVSADEVGRAVAARRAAGEKIVFTNGCFDLLHLGHVTYLEEAAAQGDALVLGLNSDASVRGLKGPTRPVRTQAERAAVLAALEYVDYVVIFDEPTPIQLIESVRPDVLVKGGDYKDKPHEVCGRELVESYGGSVYLAGLIEGVSTTQILKSIAA